MSANTPNFATMNNDELRTAIQNMYNTMSTRVAELTAELAQAQQDATNANAVAAQATANLSTMQTTMQNLNVGAAVQAAVQGLNAATQNLTNGLSNIPTTMSITQGTGTGGGLKPVKPEPFKGGRGSHARSFIQSCQLYFNLRPGDFPSDGLKIQFVLMLLQDKAALWAHPIRTDIINGVRSNRATVWTSFYDLFEAAFYDPDEQGSAMRTLTGLKQLKSATAYTSEFQQLITILGWTGDAQLKYHYYKGLKPEVKDELAKVDAPTALDDYIHLVEKIDNRIWTRKQEKKEESGGTHRPNPAPRREYHAPTPSPMLNITTNDPVPMDIGAATVRRGPISQEERQRRFREGLCMFCGGKGHKKSDCAELKKKGGVARAAMIRATETEETATEESGKGHHS